MFESLLFVAVNVVTSTKDVPNWVLIVGFISCGVSLLFPRVMWFWQEGWKFRGDVEPSGLWLFVTRLAGLAGIILLFWVMNGAKPLN